MTEGKPRVLVLALGGTIAMTQSETGGIRPGLDGTDIVSTVPGLDAIAEIEVRSPFQLPGASLTIAHVISVADMIAKATTEGFDGAVVVQGTDTIEETAFILECLGKGEIPVVVTGAMRGPQTAGADGPANLLAAVTVASSDQAQSLGVLVVLNDTVHSAIYVRKGHTHLPSSFTSAPFGPVGFVVEGAFIVYMTPRRSKRVSLHPSIPLPAVAIITLGLDDDCRLLTSLPDIGYRGVVISGMGVGHAPESTIQALSVLAQRIPTVLSSRVSEGSTFTNTYGFPGSERDLLTRGLIPSGYINSIKARILLILLLSTISIEDIPGSFHLFF